MDHLTQAQSSINGSFSGNTGNRNVVGSKNTTININGTGDTINIGVGNEGGVLGVGHQAPKPHRLIPYARNNTFTGRKNLVETVGRFSARKGHNRVALYGLGGSGKTQIALECVHQRAGESDCDIFWVQGSGALKFSEGFRAIAHHIRIPLASAEGDEAGFLQGIRRWFESPNSGDWTLVIDNADNEADFVSNNSPIAKFIPQGTKGTLIFTTRSRQVASRQGCEMIEVGKMSEEEAEELFSKRFRRWESLPEEEKTAIRTILGSVHHLPLAIIGSAAFMIETATLPSAYWSIFLENEERMGKLLSEEFCDIQRETDVTESILGTYFVTFDRIRQQMPLAADLLWLMASFDRQNIPEDLLRQCGLEGADDSVEFRRAIGNLLGFSLVTSVERDNNTFYELHRLVQLSLHVYLPTEDLNRWKATALQVISRLLPRSPDTQRSMGAAYIQHALAVTKDSKDPIAEGLCFRMGEYFLDTGSYNNAEIQVRRCIALREEGKKCDWDGNGEERLMLLALVNSYQGRYDESEAMNRRVLEGREQILGPDHPDTLTSLSRLARVLRKQGKYSESERMNRRVLEGREKVLGPDHLDALSSLGNLARVLQEQGKYVESEAMHRRVLQGHQKVLGPHHPGTLTSLGNLATTLADQGRYDEAETMHRRELEVSEKVLGPDHPDTLASLGNLAGVLGRQGKYVESEAMNRRVLQGNEKVLGPGHPDTLTSLSNLAAVLGKQGKHVESEAMNRRVLHGREKVLGPGHPDTLTSLSRLARVLRKQGKYDESMAMSRRVLEGHERVLGLDHPDTLASLGNLARVLQAQGKYALSEAMHRRALAGHEKILGPHHPDTLVSLGNLASTLADQGKYDEAETMHWYELEVSEKVLGPDHPDTLTSLGNLAGVLGKQGKYVESETMHRAVLAGRQKVLGRDHPDTLTGLRNLAGVLREQGKYYELEMVNRRTHKSVPRKCHWARPRL